MTRKFGWCMDNHHEGCRIHYRDSYEPEKIHECSCECHEGKIKPDLPERTFIGPDFKKKTGKRNKNSFDEDTPPPTIKRSRRKKNSG